MSEVTNLNADIRPEQLLFFEMISAAGYSQFWDRDKCIYLKSKVDDFLKVGSSGEVIMLRFFLGVWLHKNSFDFDFTDAAANLEPENMRFITDWLNSPFWP